MTRIIKRITEWDPPFPLGAFFMGFGSLMNAFDPPDLKAVTRMRVPSPGDQVRSAWFTVGNHLRTAMHGTTAEEPNDGSEDVAELPFVRHQVN